MTFSGKMTAPGAELDQNFTTNIAYTMLLNLSRDILSKKTVARDWCLVAIGSCRPMVLSLQ